jgi:hypothetical protein
MYSSQHSFLLERSKPLRASGSRTKVRNPLLRHRQNATRTPTLIGCMFLKSMSLSRRAELCSAKPKILTRLKNLVKHLAFCFAARRCFQLSESTTPDLQAAAFSQLANPSVISEAANYDIVFSESSIPCGIFSGNTTNQIFGPSFATHCR